MAGRNRRMRGIGLGLMAAAMLLAGPGYAKKNEGAAKVYVILGFHTNFYHSWRGDTPDEAGFGTDIRVAREIVRMLDEANAKGYDARGYWEGESLFTFEDIIPRFAPDIIDGIKRRITAGHDEFMPAPYSNTLFSAITPDEMHAVLAWSISNPWHSGAQDLFGSYVPVLRTQEGTGTTGQIPIMKAEGFNGLVQAYSSYSFSTISTFVPLLPPEQRFNVTRLRLDDSGEEIVLFPCVSIADFVNYVSFERWLLDLHKLQTSGQVKQDLVIHVNFDTDAETWLPLVPRGLRWVPNAGGLPELIKAVNKYDWAEFTLPSKYLATHEPVGTVTVRQDLADGGWDGNYSWAEKQPSHDIWTELEKSRLYTRRAEALAASPAKNEAIVRQAHDLLYEGRESSFFHRIRGLSTTHFGMSTPLINEERQATADQAVGAARGQAEKAERALADPLAATKPGEPNTLYEIMIQSGATVPPRPVRQLLRLPVILDDPLPNTTMADEAGRYVDYSFVNVESLGNGKLAAELMVPLTLGPGQTKTLILKKMPPLPPSPGATEAKIMLGRLANDHVELVLDRDHGVKSLTFDGQEIGGEDFLRSFITYKTAKKPESYFSQPYTFETLTDREQWRGVERARLATSIPVTTPHGPAEAKLTVTFTLPNAAPWLVADVKIAYPYTVKEDLLNNIQQHLRRYLDLRWIEVAPFELHPLLTATREAPLKVWKHNYLGVTSWYELNYGQINPKNAELDSFNHQVTAGWVAVTDKKRGLLLGESADVLTSYAFCPMRLRERDGGQQLWLNPFGSYFGKQMDYSHLGGNGLGAEIADKASSALRPNGPSYNGMTESFALLIAPYPGDQPPAELQAEAEAFFYPREAVYLRTPAGVNARLRQDVERSIAVARREQARQAQGPLPAPLAFLVNPTDVAVDVVWDEPADARIDGYELAWQKKGEADWKQATLDHTRRHRVADLANGDQYSFKLRAIGMGRQSDWTSALACKVGPVKPAGILSNVSSIQPQTVFKTLYYINVHLLTTPKKIVRPKGE
jgi:hypothetical protein